MFWVQWMSIKHNDGRRTSGVGRNISRLHLLATPDSSRTICGREVQIRVTGPLPLYDGVHHPGVCNRCQVIVAMRRMRVPALPVRKEK